ncbi:hypothetical protein [Ramlibacter albus]|uniref:Uncharacterized protein n=1 Tax=Ramlibacter albus TaxID=2079448 RepID=A0A923MBR5_9BURK|nr:hypothetical protein [Ramlibacter albus]MBC5766409.1 hypothetical protein [Ramlibacter albus]
MKDLLQLFATRADDESTGATEIDLSTQSTEEIRDGYKDLIRELLQDGGVNLDCVQVEVRDVGRAHDGRHVFLGMLRLAHWERKSGLRLMIGLPLVERLLRRLLRGSWLNDVSHFGGLWFHPASSMIDGEVMRELRELMQAVEQVDGASASQPPRESMWSVPAELEPDREPHTPAGPSGPR